MTGETKQLSAYEQECARKCEWCAKGNRQTPQHMHYVRFDYSAEDYRYDPCKAPTLSNFAEQKAKEAAEERTAREAAEAALVKMGRALTEAMQSEQQIEQERDGLKAKHREAVASCQNYAIDLGESQGRERRLREDIDGLSDEVAKLKAALEGVRVCGKCQGRGKPRYTFHGEHPQDKCPACAGRGVLLPPESGEVRG